MSCHCTPKALLNAGLDIALTTGDFSMMSAKELHYHSMSHKVMAARYVALTGDIPKGMDHDGATYLLMMAAQAMGLGACTEVKVRYEGDKHPKSIDLVIYAPDHTCSASALLIVEYKTALRTQGGIRKALEQVDRYGDMFKKPDVPRVVVAPDVKPATYGDTQVMDPSAFVTLLRLEATKVAVAEELAAA